MSFDFYIPKTKWKCLETLAVWYPDEKKFKRMRLKQLQAIIINKRKGGN